jgi:flagella basal body P-ring formation protein FlgA
MFGMATIFRRVVAACVVLLVIIWQPVSAEEYHEHALIREAVAKQLRAEGVSAGSRVDIVVDELDRRVRLARCTIPLKVSLPYGRKQATRLTAQVHCNGAKPWKIYVPARLTIHHRVVVAARPLARGTILTADDVVLTEHATGTLGYGYIQDPDHAVGHELRRPVQAGKVLTPGVLAAPTLIKRGQRVNLLAGSSGIAVQMAGVARADGIRGQVIDVENLNSGRRVQAVVRSAKSVEVLLK